MLLEWVKVVGPLILSWPVVLIFAVIFLRPQVQKLIEAFIARSGGKAELGPLKIELGDVAKDSREAVSLVNQIIRVMAESRVLELQITLDKFSGQLPEEQCQRIQADMAKLFALIG